MHHCPATSVGPSNTSCLTGTTKRLNRKPSYLFIYFLALGRRYYDVDGLTIGKERAETVEVKGTVNCEMCSLAILSQTGLSNGHNRTGKETFFKKPSNRLLKFSCLVAAFLKLKETL